MGHVNILYCVLQDWRKLEPHEEDPSPAWRDSHSAVCLGYGGDHPQLLVTGGRSSDLTVPSDVWILDLQSGRWREVRVQEYTEHN